MTSKCDIIEPIRRYRMTTIIIFIVGIAYIVFGYKISVRIREIQSKPARIIAIAGAVLAFGIIGIAGVLTSYETNNGKDWLV